MTSRELYKRFTSLCQKWPRDESKAGRDYGEYFRKELSEFFPQGEFSQVKDAQKVDAKLKPLERIASNQYYNEKQLKRSSASGMEGWACRGAVSNEGIRAVQEQDETSLIQRLKISLNFKFKK